MSRPKNRWVSTSFILDLRWQLYLQDHMVWEANVPIILKQAHGVQWPVAQLPLLLLQRRPEQMKIEVLLRSLSLITHVPKRRAAMWTMGSISLLFAMMPTCWRENSQFWSMTGVLAAASSSWRMKHSDWRIRNFWMSCGLLGKIWSPR